MKFPKHLALTIEHNDHKTIYQNIVDYIVNSNLEDSFNSELEMNEAIDNDELWVIYYHPATPVGHCRLSAPTLEKLLNLIYKMEKNLVEY